jgi:esterase/lipase superfamily enzyme
MSNLTFDEKLIREHTPEPLEGHTVVVLERVGDLGEKFHSLLEPGAERPRRGLLFFLRKPDTYFAFAVDASRSRSLSFTEHVVMEDRPHELDLHFSLWYRVVDPQLLVATRESDPLQRVRSHVAEVVTREIAELPWSEVWHSFRATSESVVCSTLAKLKSFARDYGISIASLRLRAKLPASATEVERKIDASRDRARLTRELMDAAQELHIHRSNLPRETAGRDELDRADAARRRLQDAVIGKIKEEYGELIRGASTLEELRDIQERLSGIPGPAIAPALGDETRLLLPGGGRLYRVWYATNRRPTDDGLEIGYGVRLDDRVHYGSCDVVIPASHKYGSLGSSWVRRFFRGVDDRLQVHEVAPREEESFWTRVRHYAASFSPEHRHALVFIHGYRVSFRDAALRAAQLGYDLDVKGPVAFFSWPSRATVMGYLKDGSAVEASEKAITDFLIRFVRDCGADRVHVIAHSMGNRPLMRALQRIASAKEQDPVRFGHLVLAAPDVNREIFLEIADGYRRLSQRTTLYVSDVDRALRASYRLQGSRVGLAPPVTCVPGIDTVHVANVDRTMLGHSTFAEARPVLYDIHMLLNQNTPPELRPGLTERLQGSDRYWEVRA